MKVLLLGGGGREHALARGLHQSSYVNSLYCAPGNAGIGEIATLYDMDPTRKEEVLPLAREIMPDLVVRERGPSFWTPWTKPQRPATTS